MRNATQVIPLPDERFCIDLEGMFFKVSLIKRPHDWFIFNIDTINKDDDWLDATVEFPPKNYLENLVGTLNPQAVLPQVRGANRRHYGGQG